MFTAAWLAASRTEKQTFPFLWGQAAQGHFIQSSWWQFCFKLDTLILRGSLYSNIPVSIKSQVHSLFATVYVVCFSSNIFTKLSYVFRPLEKRSCFLKVPKAEELNIPSCNLSHSHSTYCFDQFVLNCPQIVYVLWNSLEFITLLPIKKEKKKDSWVTQ